MNRPSTYDRTTTMTEPAPRRSPTFVGTRGAPAPQNLGDILERVLDKGVVIAGDIQVRLLDIELLTIKVRLLVASVDRAREMGINWWEGDPFVTSLEGGRPDDRGTAELQSRVAELEQRLARTSAGSEPAQGSELAQGEEDPDERR